MSCSRENPMSIPRGHRGPVIGLTMTLTEKLPAFVPTECSRRRKFPNTNVRPTISMLI